jgi:hypothetical protein
MAKQRTIRYGVVGLGHIAQVAVIPAFAHARRNSQLVAIVSGNRIKRREVARRYRINHAFTYEEFDECLRVVDAVYIALPNSMHAEYAIRAARAGVHVLCEKPMAVTVEECRQMISACRKAKVKLMIAYRLHFEGVNLAAIDIARSGQLGALKFFNSSFSMTVRRGDIRTKRALGGGTLYDIGSIASTPRAISFARSRPAYQPSPSTAASRVYPRSTRQPPQRCVLGTIASPLSLQVSMRPMSPHIASWARKATCTSTPPTNMPRASSTR